MPGSLHILAPAKLNLALSVGPKQANGMHPICSWMVTVNLFDELNVTRLDSDRFSRYAIIWHREAKRRSDIDWSIRHDLAVRAHLALEDRVGKRLPVQLKLEKRIPVGGGLGGGSSDAAAMLRAVNQLYELGLSRDELRTIAHDLGSDVPFLVEGGSAIVSGLGEQIDAHGNTPDLSAVIIFPDAICHTRGVYETFDRQGGAELQPETIASIACNAMGTPSPDTLFNDLTAATLHASPGLQQDLQRVSTLAQRHVYISGSGSSMFALCDSPLHAEALAAEIQSQLSMPAVAVKSHAAVTV